MTSRIIQFSHRTLYNSKQKIKSKIIIIFSYNHLNIKAMKQIYLIILAMTLIIAGCSESKIIEPKVLSGETLQALVVSAANQDKKANDSLSSLIDLNIKENYLYNSLKVDSFYLDSVKYFSVLLEYPNPVHNRLAIYDTAANCYLIDKSLNGKLSFEVMELDNSKFLKAVEKFISKDTLILTRVSLYRKIANSINLTYRSFAELKTLKNHFYQTINFISEDTIKTLIQAPKIFKLNSEDVFIFNYADKKYQSNQSLFDSLVYRQIADFNFDPQKPQVK